jgi:hypothetical protein
MQREGRYDLTEPVVMGVDVARFRDDMSVMAFRELTTGPRSSCRLVG